MKSALALIALLALQSTPEQDRQKLKQAMGDTSLAGTWFYDDVEGGVAEARRTGKPLLVVLRCVPCKSGRELDDAVRRRSDADLAALLDRFVCVRVVQGYGLDLRLFQFDWRQTWAAFLMNGEQAIYGRFEARDANDVIGFRRALEGALELHAKWPANKAELAGKTGPAPRWSRPEEIPAIAEKKPRSTTSRNGCIHCHNFLEEGVKSAEALKEPVSERDRAPYPFPQQVGMLLSTKERATVTSVDRKSPAEQAGVKVGDRILRFGGQPIIAWSDVSWVLYLSKEGDALKVDVDRAGSPVELTLTLPAGWRTR